MSEFDSVPFATITADLGEGVVAQDVSAWSVSRSLSGGGLPGQARAASGSSVGQGTVTVESPAGRTPWTAGPIKPGGKVALDAAEDTGVVASPQGRMVVRTVGGPSALSSERVLDIEDDITALRGPVTIPSAISEGIINTGGDTSTETLFDAAWALVLAAASGGFYASPPPVRSCVLSVPMLGTMVAERGRTVSTNSGIWFTRGGSVQGEATDFTGEATEDLSRFTSIYITMRTSGGKWGLLMGGGFTFQRSGASQWSIYARAGNAAGPVGPTVTWDATFPVAESGRVQVETQPLGFNPITGTYTGFRVRGRSGPSSPWSAWSTATAPAPYVPTLVGSTVDPLRAVQINGSQTDYGPNQRFAQVQVHTEDDTGVWAQDTALIAGTGSMLNGLIFKGSQPAWDLMQEIATATLGAVWVAEDGVLTYRNREMTRGGAATVETIVAERSLDDVPWSIGMDDVADRVEVTYQPPDFARVTNDSLTVWESTEVVAIRARATVTIEQDLEGAAAYLSEWRPIWDTTLPAGRGSRWAASVNREGGGIRPVDNALSVTATLLNPSRVRIRITNNTAGTLYTVGDAGTTQLTLRANVVVRPGEPQVVARGVPAEVARSPLAVNSGAWVQRFDAAEEMLSWLVSNTSEPLPVLMGVRVTPKASRRLGDIVRVRDPQYTGLASKALVVGIRSEGSDGVLSQSLDLAILSTNFNDVDAWLVKNGLNTFDKLDAWLTANGMTTFDALDAFLTTVGGLE